MTSYRTCVCLFFVLALATFFPLAADPARTLDPLGLERLLESSGGAVSLHRATGAVRFLRVGPQGLALSGAGPAERAADLLRRHGSVFGLSDPQGQLTPPSIRVDGLGRTHVGYRQLHRGLPVFAGELRVHFDAEDRLTAVNGTFIPAVAVDPSPERTVQEAAGIAVSDVLHRAGRTGQADVVARGTRLLVYRSGLLQGIAGRDHLVFEVEVGDGASLREFVYVDAHTGKVVERISGIHDGLDRKVHEPQFNAVVVWSEGDTLPYTTGDPVNDDQVNGLIDFSAGVYDLFLNLSGGSYPSWDGLDGTMHSVWKAPLNCPNASWNGTSTNYCDGVASDDVVAHEWAHAYTQATHGLIYKWQPGALNESYSDIFGETYDTLNGVGTDGPAFPRTAGDCSTYGGKMPPAFQVDAPVSIAGVYLSSGANFNPAAPVTVSGSVELVDDGDDQGGQSSVHDGCQALIGFTPGKIALVERGNCNYTTKVLGAQAAGASAVIVINSAAGVVNMSGTNPSITIPSVMVQDSDGQLIRDELANGVTATITLPVPTAVSVRWMMGEDSTGFGVAIRDMWNPNCDSDPGKVSDLYYLCGAGDSGGVHSNSGVPNHAFALLVDGGDYNGRTVASIGKTKALHVYWRAMQIYQVEASDFADHADALIQSCNDLLGVDLTHLQTGAPSGQTLSPANCASVAEALLAVEMADPPPCDFAPLLDPDPPAPTCGTVAFFDDFETDPSASWSLSNSGVYAEYSPRDWEWTASVPPGGDGFAFFAIDDIEIGNCIAGDNDQSGVMLLESPPITLESVAPLLVFDHYVATESRFDGGNVKISVNGGPFVLIPGSDYLFNAYNDTLISSLDGNTSPLAGAEAFTGSDGGAVTGSWGESQVDLSSHATAGDTIRLRFDFGVDGCNGLIGWYVDDVTVCTSSVAAGRVPDGADLPGTPLTLAAAPGGQITLSWGPSCLAGDNDYAIYDGSLGDFTGHTPVACSTGGATTETFAPSPGDRYYLVVPQNGVREGSYGSTSGSSERPQSLAPCLDQVIAADCS